MSFRAVVMAGGRGSRLGEAAEGLPKALLPLADGYVLGRILDQLVAGGCDAVDLCLGFRAGDIVARVGSSWHGVPVAHHCEDMPLGTAGALRQVLVAVDNWPDAVVVVNCDIVAELDFASSVQRHRKHCAAASVMTVQMVQTLRYGTVEAQGDGFAVTGLQEKPQTVFRAIAGIYLFRTASLVKALSGSTGHLDMPDLLVRFLAEDGGGLVNLDLDGTWIDIGIPEDYLRAREAFA